MQNSNPTPQAINGYPVKSVYRTPQKIQVVFTTPVRWGKKTNLELLKTFAGVELDWRDNLTVDIYPQQ